MGRAVSTQTMHQKCVYKRSHGSADLAERQHGSERKRIRRSGVVWLLYRPAVWCDAVHRCIHLPMFRRDLVPSPALKIGATCSSNSRYIFTRLHGVTSHNSVVSTKLHDVTSHNIVHTYQITRRHIPQHCTYLPDYTASHPTLYISTRLHGVTSHNTVHNYQTAGRHIQQHCSYLPDCTASHPTTLYISTRLHGVTSHNTVAVITSHAPTATADTVNVILHCRSF
jgi:hypothetical protein